MQAIHRNLARAYKLQGVAGHPAPEAIREITHRSKLYIKDRLLSQVLVDLYLPIQHPAGLDPWAFQNPSPYGWQERGIYL